MLAPTSSSCWVDTLVYGMEQPKVSPWPSRLVFGASPALTQQVPPPWVDSWGRCPLPTQSKTGLSLFPWAGVTGCDAGDASGHVLKVLEGAQGFISLPPRSAGEKPFWLVRRRKRTA